MNSIPTPDGADTTEWEDLVKRALKCIEMFLEDVPVLRLIAAPEKCAADIESAYMNSVRMNGAANADVEFSEWMQIFGGRALREFAYLDLDGDEMQACCVEIAWNEAVTVAEGILDPHLAKEAERT